MTVADMLPLLFLSHFFTWFRLKTGPERSFETAGGKSACLLRQLETAAADTPASSAISNKPTKSSLRLGILDFQFTTTLRFTMLTTFTELSSDNASKITKLAPLAYFDNLQYADSCLECGRYYPNIFEPRMATTLTATSVETSDRFPTSAIATQFGWSPELVKGRLTKAQLPGLNASVQARLLRSQFGDPVLWILCATSLRDAECEGERIVRQFPDTPVAIAFDQNAERSSVIRFRPGRNSVDISSSIEAFRARESLAKVAHISQPSDAASSVRVQEPLSETVENLLFELHSDLRDIDGMHPDAALDELCKILLAKTRDERINGRPRLQRAGCLCDEELAAVARQVYCSAQSDLGPSVAGAFAAPLLCTTQALVRLIDRLSKFHLHSSAIDIKARAFQNVLLPAIRAGMGQFFTPLPVIKFMVAVTRPTGGETVIDPFAGSGHFLTESLRQAAIDSTEGMPRAWGIEKSERMVRIALTDMLLNDLGELKLLCADSLSDFTKLDGLSAEIADVVLTNPPFGSLLRDSSIAELGTFSINLGRKSAPLEVLALERCMQLLRPGGRIGIVLPDGLLANSGSQYVRDWVSRHFVPRAIVSLPSATFAPYGANVKTSILFLRKAQTEHRSGTERVFLGTVDSVGYDSSGRSIASNDLDQVAAAIREFLETEGW